MTWPASLQLGFRLQTAADHHLEVRAEYKELNEKHEELEMAYKEKHRHYMVTKQELDRLSSGRQGLEPTLDPVNSKTDATAAVAVTSPADAAALNRSPHPRLHQQRTATPHHGDHEERFRHGRQELEPVLGEMNSKSGAVATIAASPAAGSLTFERHAHPSLYHHQISTPGHADNEDRYRHQQAYMSANYSRGIPRQAPVAERNGRYHISECKLFLKTPSSSRQLTKA